MRCVAGGQNTMTATSTPGFSLKQENIGFAVQAEIPCVVVDVQRWDRPPECPRLPPRVTLCRQGGALTAIMRIVVLSPSSVLEAYTLTVDAFNIAEELRTPVILLMDEMVITFARKLCFPN